MSSTLPLSNMENIDIKDPLLMGHLVRLEDIEPPATPESFKGEMSSDSVKTESPKVCKPVLGKIQAKKRLMAFANKFNPIPKVHKLKVKGDKVKREEKILAIEEIVREENKSRLAAQEAKDMNIRNALNERRAREIHRDKRSEDHYSRRSGSSYRRKNDRERRHSRDRRSRSRSRSRQRTSRKTSQEDERYSKSKHKDKKDKKDKNEKKDRKDDSKYKQDELKHKEESFKLSDKNRKEDIRSENVKEYDKKVEQLKPDTKLEFNKILGVHSDKKDKKQNFNIEEANKSDDFKLENIRNIIDNNQEQLQKAEPKEEFKEDFEINEINNIEEIKLDKIDKFDKIDVTTKEDSQIDEINKDIQKIEQNKRDESKLDTEKKEEVNVERPRRDSKSDTGKKEDTKFDKLKKDDSKLETTKREELKIDAKRDDERDDTKTKRDDILCKRANSRDKKQDRFDMKEKREEPRIKVHREREREKDKLREIREKELSKCHSWKDFIKYGFFIEDVGYIRRSDNGEKMSKSRSAQDYNQYFEQLLMLSDVRQHRYPFLAEGLNGPKEYPPETIKATKMKPTLLYCENPRYPIYFELQHVLNVVSPNRREKMEDICEAKQIRIITSEREEGHHERLWYKTMDPSKSITIRTSIDVPSFPRSKWDSENELSEDDNVFEKSPQEIILTKENESDTSSTESELEIQQESPKSQLELLKSQSEIQKIQLESGEQPTLPEIKNTVEHQIEESSKGKSKHRHKSKYSRSPSPKRKDKSPAHKKYKDDKNKHEKHRSREEKHHHHHHQHQHQHKDKKQIEEPKEPLVEKPSEEKSVTPDQEIGDEKLVSEYEQFIKMVSNADSTTKSVIPSSIEAQDVATAHVSSPSTFYEFSLEAKLLKETSCNTEKENELSTTIEKSHIEADSSKDVSTAQSNNNAIRIEKEQDVSNQDKESHKSVNEQEPSPESPQPQTLTEEPRIEESEGEYDSSENEEDSRSIPSDWENVKIKEEKLSDDEASENSSNTPCKVKSSKKKRKRRESWSSDSSSSTSSDSEDNKRKRRRRRRKRARKASSSESDSSDTSSSDSSSSEEVRKKKKKKADKKKKKRKRMKKLSKKLSKKLKRKRRRKASTDSSSSDSDAKPTKKKRARKAKAKKRKNKLNKQNTNDVSEKSKSKSEKSGDGKHNKTTKIKDESKKNSKSKKAILDSETVVIRKSMVDQIGASQNPVVQEGRNRGISEDTYSEWERESIPRQSERRNEENLEVNKEHRAEEISKQIERLDNESESNKESKSQEKEKREGDKVESENKNMDSNTDVKKNKKKKKEREVKNENSEFKNDWERESKCSAKVISVSDEETQKFVIHEKKPVLDWSDMDFDSLNVLSLTQLEQQVVDKREIFANEWEVDSLDAMPDSIVKNEKVESTKPKNLDKEIRYDKKTDTYIPVGVENIKESKRKKDKRVSAIRIWEDEQENADREELLLSLEKNVSDSKEKLSHEPDGKKITCKSKEDTTNTTVDEKPRRKSRWDVANQSENFANASSVMWEVECPTPAGNIWPKLTTIDMMNAKSGETSLNSPLLEAVSARVKDESAKMNSSSVCYTPPKDRDIVDSPETLRRKMEQIAMLERALTAKELELTPTDIMNNLSTMNDSMNLETSTKTETITPKDQKSKDDPIIVLKKTNEEKPTPNSWENKRPELDDALEFGIPLLTEIDSKINPPGSSYRDIFLDIESIHFENNVLNKAIKKPVEPCVSEESSKEMLKLVPKQVLSRQSTEQLKVATNSPEIFKNQICDIDNHELPKPSDIIKAEDNQTSVKIVSDKSSPSVKRKSPTLKERDIENRSKSSTVIPEKESKDKKESQSRSSKRSPTSWDSKEPIKTGSTSRNDSLSRSKSRSMSRSPRRRDDRLKLSHSKRDKRSPTKQSSSYRDNVKKNSQSNKSDRNKRRYDDGFEQDKNRDKSYKSTEILKERNYDSDRGRSTKSRIDEDVQKSWRHSDHPDYKLVNPYSNDYTFENKIRTRADSLDRDKGYSRSTSGARNRNRDSGRIFDRRDRKNSRTPDSPLLRREKLPPLRKSSPLRSSRRSPPPRSRYRSRSRSRSRTRSRSRSWSRSSRSISRSRSRSRSNSRSRFRNYDSRPLDKSRRSRSFSPIRNRYGAPDRLKLEEEQDRLEEELRRLGEPGNCLTPVPRPIDPPAAHCVTPVRPAIDRPRHMNTIIQLTGAPESQDDSGLSIPSQVSVNPDMDDGRSTPVSRYQYNNENEESEYNVYYPNRNLTYPRIADEPTDSPKRLSLDDRLELELGIKKQPSEPPAVTNYNSPGFIPNASGYTNPPPGPHHGHFMRHPPPITVVQMGDVLQVVPTEYPVRPEPPQPPPAPVTPTNQIVRIGNVLQVVPTTAVDWTANTTSQPPPSLPPNVPLVRYPPTVVPPPVPTALSPAIASPLPPVPVPMVQLPPPVKPIIPTGVPPPQLVTTPPMIFPVPKPPPPEPVAQPVYNYEAILETRRVEKEERKRLRDIKRKEKERRRFERAKRRAEKILGKSKVSPSTSTTASGIFGEASLLATLTGSDSVSTENEIKQDGATDEMKGTVSTAGEDTEPSTTSAASQDAEDEEEEDGDEEEEEDEEPEAEEDEEDQEAEEEDEENDEGHKDTAVLMKQEHINTSVIPPPPAKGILILPGFGSLSIANGLLADLEDLDFDRNKNDSKKSSGPDEEGKLSASETIKLFEKLRMKKSVQFADGVKPGEGTSPSGGEGDMPSPPPPVANLPRDLTLDISKQLRSKKIRKKPKRPKVPKTKKKVKVKIIKLKKPKISPLSSMLEDSDEADDRSPPPPPPGSPPPPHLWPAYLSTFGPDRGSSTTVNGACIPSSSSAAVTGSTAVAVAPSSAAASTLPSIQAPPTPLPLLVPPPPLNYSIQPCSKA